MVNGVSSGYVPDLSSYSTSPATGYSAAGFTGSEGSDTVELSTHEEAKKKQNKLLGWAAAGAVAIAAVACRKKLPFIGKFFEEGGGGIKEAVKDAGNVLKGAGKKSEKAASESFEGLRNNLKSAKDDLAKAEKKGLKVDIDAAKEARDAAKKAMEEYHKGAENNILRAKVALEKGKGKANKEELKALKQAVKDAKNQYKEELLAGGTKKKEASKMVEAAYTNAGTKATEELAAKSSYKTQYKSFMKTKPELRTKADTSYLKTLRVDLINMLTSNGLTKEEAIAEVKNMQQKVASRLK